MSDAPRFLPFQVSTFSDLRSSGITFSSSLNCGFHTVTIDCTLVRACALEERRTSTTTKPKPQIKPSKTQMAQCHLIDQDLSSGLTKPPLSKAMVVDWPIRGHVSTGRLTHMGSRIYLAYSELQSSIREVGSEGFGLLNTGNGSILTMQLQLQS